MNDSKIKHLLDLVIEHYIEKGEPIGSKFLYSLDETDYAPSTLRKYLNRLESEGLLFQPYNSAGRVPTIKGLSNYIEDIIESESLEMLKVDFDIQYARNGLRFIVESLGNYVDGTVVGFLKNDEYFFLGINNLLKGSLSSEIDYETTKHIIKFIEEKKIIEFLTKRVIKKGKIYYDFIESSEKIISVIYSRVDIQGYDGVISVIGSIRVDYKQNVKVLKKFFQLYNEQIG